MDDISNKTVVALLVATIVVSLGGTFIALNSVNSKLSSLGIGQITGFALIPNATATVTVQTFSSIKFSQASVAFGTGNVNVTGGFNNCTLSTLDGATGGNSGCDGFTEVSNGFTIENDGNTNLSVELRSNVTAAQFIGLGSALFLWNVTVNESSSCRNSSINVGDGIVNPNTTIGCGPNATNDIAANCGAIFEAVSTSNKNICPRLLYTDVSDALNIDINISIPVDAPAGAKVAGLVVTGTRDPTS